MGLANPRRADKKEASFFQRVVLGELLGRSLGIQQRFALAFGIEICQIATSVARRDVRGGQQASATVAHAAFTAHRFALFAALDGLPSGAAADGAGLSVRR